MTEKTKIKKKDVKEESIDKDELKKKDFWDKLSVISRPVAGLLTGLAIASVGFFGSRFLEGKQAMESNLRLYSELMTKREDSENSLRKDMFEKISQSFLKFPNEKIDDNIKNKLNQIDLKLLQLDLLARNFHDSLDMKPIFKQILHEIIYLKRSIKYEIQQKYNTGQKGKKRKE